MTRPVWKVRCLHLEEVNYLMAQTRLSKWNRFKAWAVTRLAYWYMHSGFAERWSKLWRLLFERKYRNVPIPTFCNFAELKAYLDTCEWDSDWKRWADTISYPGRIVTTKKDDCDGFALLICHAIYESIKLGKWIDRNVVREQMLTVVYQDPYGKLGAHNVALLRLDSDAEGNPTYAWMDYNLPHTLKRCRDTPYASVYEVVLDVASYYGGIGTIVLTYGVMDKTLRYNTVIRCGD